MKRRFRYYGPKGLLLFLSLVMDPFSLPISEIMIWTWFGYWPFLEAKNRGNIWGQRARPELGGQRAGPHSNQIALFP